MSDTICLAGSVFFLKRRLEVLQATAYLTGLTFLYKIVISNI